MEPFWIGMPATSNLIVGILAGYGWSLGIGGIVVSLAHGSLKNDLPKVEGEPEPEKRIPGWYTGLIERLIFTSFVIVAASAAFPALGGWLALKMAANWNKGLPPKDADKARAEGSIWNRHAFLGLLSGLISMAFAWSGGVLARFIMKI